MVNGSRQIPRKSLIDIPATHHILVCFLMLAPAVSAAAVAAAAAAATVAAAAVYLYWIV